MEKLQRFYSCAINLLLFAAIFSIPIEANRPCRAGDKLYSVNKIARNGGKDHVLIARCRNHIKTECMRACSWERTCRETEGWCRYGQGERTFVAGIRFDPQDQGKLQVYCCASMATANAAGCQWSKDRTVSKETTEEMFDLRSATVLSGINSLSDTIIRDVIVSPYEKNDDIKFRTEICRIKRERSTCDLSKLEGAEKRAYRILLLRANRARSQLICGKNNSETAEKLMDKYFKPKVRPKFVPSRQPLAAVTRAPTTRRSQPRVTPIREKTSRANPAPRRHRTTTRKPQRRRTTVRSVKRRTTPKTAKRRTTPKGRSHASKGSKEKSGEKRAKSKGKSGEQRTKSKGTTKGRVRKTTARRTTATFPPTTTTTKMQCPTPTFEPCISKEEANFRLQWCCAGLEPGCKPLCTYDLNEQKLVPIVLGRQCSTPSLAKMMNCASNFQDHNPCCRAKGVLGLCAPFCNPKGGLPGADLKYLPCLKQLPTISRCFWASLPP